MKKRKNILFILPDQMRGDYLGCYGADFAHTPNIDALAADGVLYENAISPSPLCVPARASLLTGKNAIENGILDNRNWLRPDHEECGVYTWPKLLTQRGYETVGIGKMHFYPWDEAEGFEKRIISEDKRHYEVKDDYADALEEDGLRKYHGVEYADYTELKGAMKNPLPRAAQADVWIADQTCEYIKNRDDDRPFAMMVGFLSPHCPYDPDVSLLEDFPVDNMPEPYPPTKESHRFHKRFLSDYSADWAQIDYSTFTVEQQKVIKSYYSACIKDIDLGVGRIVETLKEQGIYDDTIIIFSSDHGDYAGDFGMVSKHYFHEPSIHVPLIVRDADFTEKNISEKGIVSLTDIRATILELAGVEDNETAESKVLSCYKSQMQDRIIFGATDIGWMIRKGDWKYDCYYNGLEELYNITEDSKEQSNLVDVRQYGQLVKDLRNELNAWVMQSCINANREKIADPGAARTSRDYNNRNWERPYPYRVDIWDV